MKAIIVAAGIGSRLGELTKNTTKSLIKINNKKILERQITIFKKLGINDINVIIGPYPEQYTFQNISLIHDTKYMEHDILASFMLAQSIMDDDVIVSYGDVIFDENILKSIVDFEGLIGLGIDFDWKKNYEGRNESLMQEATVAQFDNHSCIRIVDGRELKKSKNETISSLNNSKNIKTGEFVGLMKLSKIGSSKFIQLYNKLINSHSGKFHESDSILDAYFTDMLQELIDNDVKIFSIPVEGKWCEIDTIEDVKRAEKIF